MSKRVGSGCYCWGLLAIVACNSGTGAAPSSPAESGNTTSGGTASGAAGSGGTASRLAASPPGLAAAFRLAVIGSSTAEGEGASRPANAWVALLESALAARTSFSVSNLAVGGYTTNDLLPNSDASGNLGDAIAEDPDLIVVALAGSNDLAISTPSATFLSRLSLLRDTAQAAGIPTFFVSTAPKDLSDSDRQSLADWAKSMRQRFEACWIPGSAAPYQPCFIDVFAALADSSLELAPQFDSGDGIHLDDAGHAVVFHAAEPVIEAYVCSVAACR